MYEGLAARDPRLLARAQAACALKPLQNGAGICSRMLQPLPAKRCRSPCKNGRNWQRNFCPALTHCQNPKLNHFGFKKSLPTPRSSGLTKDKVPSPNAGARAAQLNR